MCLSGQIQLMQKLHMILLLRLIQIMRIMMIDKKLFAEVHGKM